MYTTLNSALANEHLNTLRAAAAADALARQARRARRERHAQASHSIVSRRFRRAAHA